MTMPINTFQDILDALERDPALRDALRRHILSEELLQLPAAFAAFVEAQRDVDERADTLIEEQARCYANTEARLARIEAGLICLKGNNARSRTIQDASGIAADMGLEYVRTLTNEDLLRMAGNSLTRDTARSFRNADLVIEATDTHETRYIAMEISFTADRREVDRALRNANLISRFTGNTALPAVASVRNDHDIQADLDAGIVYWHPLEDRTPAVS